MSDVVIEGVGDRQITIWKGRPGSSRRKGFEKLEVVNITIEGDKSAEGKPYTSKTFLYGPEIQLVARELINENVQQETNTEATKVDTDTLAVFETFRKSTTNLQAQINSLVDRCATLEVETGQILHNVAKDYQTVADRCTNIEKAQVAMNKKGK